MRNQTDDPYKEVLEYCRKLEEAKLKVDDDLPEIVRKRIYENYYKFKNEPIEFLKREREKRMKAGGKPTKEEIQLIKEQLKLMEEHGDIEKKIKEKFDRYNIDENL